MSWRALTPAEFRSLDDRALAELKSTGRCTSYEKVYVTKDGTRVPVLVGGAAVDDLATGDRAPGSGLVGVAFIVDLREQVRLREALDRLLHREQRARAETELANARLSQQVEGSKRLSRTMNAHATLETLAAAVVPGLADWSYVVHRGWSGDGMLVAAASGDPHKQPLLRSLQGCTPDADALEGAPRVFRTGEPALYEDIAPEQLMPDAPGWPVVGTRDPEHLRTLRALGMRSLLCVPIDGRSGVEGVMMLAASVDPHRYAGEDVVLARDLAARAAVSLENGRLLSEALDAVRARDDFLAVAAHELRTPLTSLLLHVQILSRAIAQDKPGVTRPRRAQRGRGAGPGAPTVGPRRRVARRVAPGQQSALAADRGEPTGRDRRRCDVDDGARLSPRRLPGQRLRPRRRQREVGSRAHRAGADEPDEQRDEVRGR